MWPVFEAIVHIGGQQIRKPLDPAKEGLRLDISKRYRKVSHHSDHYEGHPLSLLFLFISFFFLEVSFSFSLETCQKSAIRPVACLNNQAPRTP